MTYISSPCLKRLLTCGMWKTSIAGKWLQTAIAVTRLKAVGILAQLAQVGAMRNNITAGYSPILSKEK